MKKILTIAIIVFAALQLNAQKNNTSKNFGIWSIDAGYLGSANAKNTKESKPLFAGNGLSTGLAYRYGNRWGITGRADYATGKTNNKNAQAFANTLVTAPFTAKVSGLKTNWSQVNIAIGPSVFLVEKYKAEVNVIVGISTGSARNIRIDRYDAQTFVNTVFEATEKRVKPFWEVGGSYRLATIGKTAFRIKGSVGSLGMSVGLNIDMMACRQNPKCMCMLGACPK